MAPLTYRLHAAGTTLLRRATINSNISAEFDPSLFITPILDAINAKRREGSDTITWLSFILSIVVLVPMACKLWAWIQLKQARRVLSLAKSNCQPDTVSFSRAKSGALDQLPKVENGQPNKVPIVTPFKLATTTLQRIRLPGKDVAWWQALNARDEVDIQAAWNRVVEKEPRLAVHKELLFKDKHFEMMIGGYCKVQRDRLLPLEKRMRETRIRAREHEEHQLRQRQIPSKDVEMQLTRPRLRESMDVTSAAKIRNH